MLFTNSSKVTAVISGNKGEDEHSGFTMTSECHPPTGANTKVLVATITEANQTSLKMSAYPCQFTFVLDGGNGAGASSIALTPYRVFSWFAWSRSAIRCNASRINAFSHSLTPVAESRCISLPRNAS